MSATPSCVMMKFERCHPLNLLSDKNQPLHSTGGHIVIFIVVYVLDRQFPTSTNIISVKGMHALYLQQIGQDKNKNCTWLLSSNAIRHADHAGVWIILSSSAAGTYQQQRGQCSRTAHVMLHSSSSLLAYYLHRHFSRRIFRC